MQIAEIYYRARIDTAGLQQEVKRAGMAAGNTLSSSFGQRLQQMGPGLAQMSRGVGQVTQGVDQLATRAALAGAGLGFFAIKTAASFEQAEAGIRKTVAGTTGEVDAVIASLKEMSTVVPLSFEELAGIAAEGGALGIATDGLANFTDIVARLSVSTDLSAEAASTALGQLSNVLGLSDDDLRDFGDSLVALGNDGASTESQILDMAARFGAAGKQAGLSNEAILALSSTTASMGIEAEAGGGALSRIFNGITLDIGTTTAESEVLADAMGLSLAELRTAWDEDAGQVFQELLGYLNDLDKFEQAEFLKGLGITNTRDISAISLLASGVEEYGRQLGVAEGQTNELNKESDAFFNTTEGKWEIFKNNVRLAADSFGSELLPVVNEVMGELTDRLNDPAVQAGIKRFAEDLAGGLRSFVQELKGTDFSALMGGLRLAADTARLAFDAFRSLPGPIQQLALAALVTNKVSGGAVTSIAKGLANILGGTIKMAFPKLDFFTRGATPANPLFVQMAGGLPGGGLPGGAAGGIRGAINGGGLIGGLATGVAVAAPVLAGIAVVEVIGFENMRNEQRQKLGGILDELPRTPTKIDESIARIQAQIDMERPFLEGLLFNTNVRPQLEEQVAELKNVKVTQERAVAAARDAIPWAVRNVQEVHDLNQSEGTRFADLGAKSDAQKAAIHEFNASEGTRAANAMALMQADTAAVHTLNSNEGIRAANAMAAMHTFDTNEGTRALATQSAVHTFNASEGNRFLTLGGKVDADQAAVHALNANEGARFSNLGARVDASSSKNAVYALNASEGTRFANLGGRVGAVEGAINRMHGTLAAKRFEAVVQQTQNYFNQTGTLGGATGAGVRTGAGPVPYAEGSWSIPEDQLAYVHRGEMVVPATPAEWMRRMGAGESGASNVTVNLQGLVKARSVREIGTELKRMADFGYFSAQQQPLLNRSVKMR